MRIYIRHGEKAYKNGENVQYKYDPSLTYDGVSLSTNTAEDLIKKYGLPQYILTSPYMRTRETALAMAEVVKSHSIDVSIKICIELSCYLKFPNIVKEDFRDITAKYQPPINENYYSFVKRMKKHKEIHEYIDSSNIPIWYITHKTNMKKICSLNSYLCDEIDYLDCIIFEGERGNLSNCYKYNNKGEEKIEFNILHKNEEKNFFNYRETKKIVETKNLNDTGIILDDS